MISKSSSDAWSDLGSFVFAVVCTSVILASFVLALVTPGWPRVAWALATAVVGATFADWVRRHT